MRNIVNSDEQSDNGVSRGFDRLILRVAHLQVAHLQTHLEVAANIKFRESPSFEDQESSSFKIHYLDYQDF